MPLILTAARTCNAAAPAAIGGGFHFQNLKERSMTPKFLREEAARFRGMAEENSRDASKLRLLAMAADYEARATTADGLVVAPPVEEAAPASTDHDVSGSEAGGKIDLGLKDDAPGGRRPLGRPRLRLNP